MSTATAATPPQSFQLDRNLFNQNLYNDIRNFWFEGLSENATTAPLPVLQRWWGFGRTDEEKTAFDQECRTRFGPALESLGPSKLGFPPFTSYEEEIAQAEKLSAPVLREVVEAQREDERKGAETMLALILLLDQIPRQIYRDPPGLRLVYNHYDRLAYTLVRSCLALQPSPVDHELWTARPAYKTWIVMPLVHSEHVPTHEIHKRKIEGLRRECEVAGDEPALGYTARAEQAEQEHLDPLRRFGRYPHRNECLGRRNTGEEEEFLKTAKTFGVRQEGSGKGGGGEKDEL
ncbi:hypothetical protein B0A50_00474 [Salinomyces thailandicus]|uniref:DUF924-domain-containing protein n=1 Tax=Salinomyces thailandicus TaxID=706561 RepID=A0A4U0UDQ8_9PEZI|nr:hypothetical protein B0A50_00474 [Salinomyces thailandica]